jgi:hypothetical protein
MESTERRVPADKLVIGVALIVVGIAGTLTALDILQFRDAGRLWPLILIIIGLGTEAEALRNRREGGGWILIAIGTWFLVGNFHLFGLSHGRALPIAAIIAGAAIALHALVDKPTSKENTHDESHQ